PHRSGSAVPASGLVLAPAYARRLAEPLPPATPPRAPILPRLPTPVAAAIQAVEDRAAAEAMLDFAAQRRIGWIGLDFEFRYSRPAVVVGRTGGRDRTWHDPRSIVPLLAGVVLVEAGPDGRAAFYRYAVDVRRPEVLGPLGALLRRPIPVVAHYVQVEL